MQNFAQRGLYFEEFEVGQTLTTPGRTISESDINLFAGLSGDHNAIHTDAQFAKTTPFGQRVAHGLLSLSIASGLAVRTGVMEGTVIAFREIRDWKFSLPVFIGDTIHAQVTVTKTQALPRLGGGSVELKVAVKNQDQQVVMRGTWVVLIKSKPA
jgi:acyl dehydratase